MEMPFTQSEPRFTMWSKSPSILINLPSRTVATMPQPHEQKLQEVVNSLTSESFNFRVLACTAATSTRLLSANPAQPPAAVLNHSLRVTPATVFDDSPTQFSICPLIPSSSLLFGSKVCSILHESELRLSAGGHFFPEQSQCAERPSMPLRSFGHRGGAELE